jgi:hypothetical protein
LVAFEDHIGFFLFLDDYGEAVVVGLEHLAQLLVFFEEELVRLLKVLQFYQIGLKLAVYLGFFVSLGIKL